MRVTDHSQILAQLMSTQAAFQLYKCLGLIKTLMALQSERGVLLSHAHLVGRTHTQQSMCYSKSSAAHAGFTAPNPIV